MVTALVLHDVTGADVQRRIAATRRRIEARERARLARALWHIDYSAPGVDPYWLPREA